MKLLLNLATFCITLALGRGACINFPPTILESNDGKLVFQDQCTDPYDKSTHPVESEWNSANCMHCKCFDGGEMKCCDRSGGIGRVPGCAAVVDPETCMTLFYRLDDPSKLCGMS
ncbi:small serum protein 1-like [Hemicordylus capensis]|uniref:small serum protein 1-like n=1 Tax=Hemicordylus capensis TaxID=884348 RepID=UPI002304CCBE|nr:small serum protein 1-like [Hemicordylus capensis]